MASKSTFAGKRRRDDNGLVIVANNELVIRQISRAVLEPGFFMLLL